MNTIRLAVFLGGILTSFIAVSDPKLLHDDSNALFLKSKISHLPWVVSLSGGPMWGNASQTQSLYLSPQDENKYVASNPTNSLFAGEAFIGFSRKLNPITDIQFGILAAATGHTSLSGSIWQDANPEFNNFNYKYKTQYTRLALGAKLLRNISIQKLKPYIKGSLGVGINRAYSFQTESLLFQAIPSPDFTANTMASFTYSVGIGIQRAISDSLQLGIGYEFTDWGKSKLGPALDLLDTSLASNKFLTNGFSVNLTWLKQGA